MRYSLVSRFQGAWLGSILGEGEIWPHPQRPLSHPPDRLWTWLEIQQAIAQMTATPDKSTTAFLRNRTAIAAEIESTPMTSAVLAVLLLPIIFLHHEDRENLQSRLVDAIAQDWIQRLPTLANFDGNADVCLWGNAMSLVLLDTLAPDLFLVQLLDRSRSLSTPLVDAIAEFPQALSHSLSWTALQRQWSLHLNPSQQAIAGALFCFLTTPESWGVAMARSRFVPQPSPWLSALVGAISGCYNSNSGLPFRSLQLLPHNIKTEICQYSQQLLTIWSGGLPSPSYTASVQAIAPAGKLQKRRSRPIISQKF
ncbi:MAG: hypothetical protein ACLFV6_08305 [Spirulinaceae cyanobacterium]